MLLKARVTVVCMRCMLADAYGARCYAQRLLLHDDQVSVTCDPLPEMSIYNCLLLLQQHTDVFMRTCIKCQTECLHAKLLVTLDGLHLALKQDGALQQHLQLAGTTILQRISCWLTCCLLPPPVYCSTLYIAAQCHNLAPTVRTC